MQRGIIWPAPNEFLMIHIGRCHIVQVIPTNMILQMLSP